MSDSQDDKFVGSASVGDQALSAQSPQVVGDLLSLLTHDLRNPLAALSSNAGYLEMFNENLSQDAQEAIADLRLSVEAMGRIVESLELVCHDLKDQPAPSASSSHVGELISGIWPQVQRAAESHGVELELDISAVAELRILAGAAPFSRALAGLVHNALSVAPARSTVVLSGHREGSGLCFQVRDEGPVLSPKFLPAVFSAEGQVQFKTEIGARYSRGLGLFVVARSAHWAGAVLRSGQGNQGNQGNQGSLLELVVPVCK